MASWRSMMNKEGSRSASGSISQRHGCADPDPDPDPHQNVMDPQHWFFLWTKKDICWGNSRAPHPGVLFTLIPQQIPSLVSTHIIGSKFLPINERIVWGSFPAFSSVHRSSISLFFLRVLFDNLFSEFGIAIFFFCKNCLCAKRSTYETPSRVRKMNNK